MINTQDINFWEERLEESEDPLEAVGSGFNWLALDVKHREILGRYYKGGKVLDVACGIGRTCKWFKPENYLGIDFVPGFIEVAKEKNPKHEFRVLDVKQYPLPFDDDEFELGLLISVKKVIGPVIGLGKWLKIEDELKRICNKVLILEYGANDPFEYSRYECL